MKNERSLSFCSFSFQLSMTESKRFATPEALKFEWSCLLANLTLCIHTNQLENNIFALLGVFQGNFGRMALKQRNQI